MSKQHLCVVPIFLIWKVNDNASLPGNFDVLSGYQSDEGVGQWTQYFDFFMELSLATAFQSILFLSLTLSSHTVN